MVRNSVSGETDGGRTEGLDPAMVTSESIHRSRESGKLRGLCGFGVVPINELSSTCRDEGV